MLCVLFLGARMRALQMDPKTVTKTLASIGEPVPRPGGGSFEVAGKRAERIAGWILEFSDMTDERSVEVDVDETGEKGTTAEGGLRTSEYCTNALPTRSKSTGTTHSATCHPFTFDARATRR